MVKKKKKARRGETHERERSRSPHAANRKGDSRKGDSHKGDSRKGKPSTRTDGKGQPVSGKGKRSLSAKGDEGRKGKKPRSDGKSRKGSAAGKGVLDPARVEADARTFWNQIGESGWTGQERRDSTSTTGTALTADHRWEVAENAPTIDIPFIFKEEWNEDSILLRKGAQIGRAHV